MAESNAIGNYGVLQDQVTASRHFYNARVAMVGAGQLARMTHQAAVDLDIELLVLAASANDSAVLGGAGYVLGVSGNLADLETIASGADVVTFDHELISPSNLVAMQELKYNLQPRPSALYLAQDKLEARRSLSARGFPCPAFIPVGSTDEVVGFAEKYGWPVVLKARHGGYDGRGVRVVHSADELNLAGIPEGISQPADVDFSDRTKRYRESSTDGKTNIHTESNADSHAEGHLDGYRYSHAEGHPDDYRDGDTKGYAGGDQAIYVNEPAYIVEEYIDISVELSIIVARSPSGEVAVYPPVQTTQSDGICRYLVMPAPLPERLSKQACELAKSIIVEIGATGIVAVEMFVTSEGRLLVNELALRPHNSGHATIEASMTSQFHQHLRAILDWPLGSTDMRVPAAAMVNLIGGDNCAGSLSAVRAALAIPNINIHLYGKDLRPRRKLGHITATASSVEEALQSAFRAASCFGVAA